MTMSLNFIENNASKEYLEKIEELTRKLMKTKGIEYYDAKIKTVKYLIQNDSCDEMVGLRIKYFKQRKITKF